MSVHVVLGTLLGVPVDPDAETARGWVRDELAKAIYHQQPSLIERLWSWLTVQLARFLASLSGADTRSAGLVIVVALVVVAVTALLVAGPVRRNRAARRASAGVFDDDTRSAAQLLQSADRHASDGHWGPAVLDRFRAMLRTLEDRTVLEPRPGRTADEGARDAGERLPGCAVELVAAARLFDDVCYGDVRPDESDDAFLRQVASQVAAERPAAPGSPVHDAPAAVSA